jgi:hypothetical protein
MSATNPVHSQSNAQESAVEDYVVSFCENHPGTYLRDHAEALTRSSRRPDDPSVDYPTDRYFGELQGKFEAYLSANRTVGSMKGQNGYTA